MINNLKKVLIQLRNEYKDREKIIKNNKKIIENSPINEENVDSKLELDRINTKLEEKNKSNEELQHNIIEYLKNQLNFINTEDAPTEYLDCLELTILGDMDYNPRHPFFGDQDFYNDLLEYLIKVEDYEKCNMIQRRKEKFSN